MLISMKRISIILFSLFLSGCDLFAQDDPAPDSTNNPSDTSDIPTDDTAQYISSETSLDDPYSYINFLRTQAGMTTLGKQESLAGAALNHANYLKLNETFGHTQSNGLIGFTGVNPGDRAVEQNYSTFKVTEGVANGRTDIDGLDNLMSAIYHRFTLMDNTKDSIGMGYVAIDTNNGILVHNMANDEVNATCERQVAANSYYVGLCSPDFNVSSTEIDSASESRAQLNPELTLWPPENGTDIMPVFYEETPDPLADHSVSGYPVSVQFNSAKVSSAAVSSFQVYNIDEQAYLSSTRLMSETSDPNNIFSSLDFTLFPLQRLEWATEYRVELEYIQDGVNNTKQWVFKTRELDGPLIRLDSSESSAQLSNNKKSYIYIVPTHSTDVISTFVSTYPQTTSVTADFKDSNTLAVTASGGGGDKIEFVLNNSRTITLTLI